MVYASLSSLCMMAHTGLSEVQTSTLSLTLMAEQTLFVLIDSSLLILIRSLLTLKL